MIRDVQKLLRLRQLLCLLRWQGILFLLWL